MSAVMSVSDEELTALLDDLESDRVERKRSWEGHVSEKARQAVCAFANDLPDHRRPGVLFIGVRDDGTPEGLEINDNLLKTLADMRSDGNITPPPSLTVQKRNLKGSDVAVVLVQPSDAPPVRYKGMIWVRTGPRRGHASAQDERILNEKRRARDICFDATPIPGAKVSDLSRLLFEEEYLPNAFHPDVLAANGRSYEQRLASCGMIASADAPVPTLTGILVLGKDPREFIPSAFIQFLRIGGSDLSDPVEDEEEVSGHLSEMLRRLDEKLNAHNRVEVDLTTGHREARQALYPMAALRQIVNNAVMHRTYEATNSPVRVNWFDDRIEVHSPGGPFGIVTQENFGQGLTDYRNPRLAEAMKALGYVQRFGVGIQTARRELEKNGNPPPEFSVGPTAVTVVVRRGT